MYSGFFSASSKPKMVLIDTGFDIINRIIDAVLIFAIVAAMRLVFLEAYQCVSKGSFSKSRLKPLLKKMCEEGAYWGIIVGLYVGMEYGLRMTNIVGGWNSAMLGGALTGGIVSAACDNGKDKIAEDAITGGAIATAVQLLQYLT